MTPAGADHIEFFLNTHIKKVAFSRRLFTVFAYPLIKIVRETGSFLLGAT
jgi:hypothetical protein